MSHMAAAQQVFMFVLSSCNLVKTLFLALKRLVSIGSFIYYCYVQTVHLGKN